MIQAIIDKEESRNCVEVEATLTNAAAAVEETRCMLVYLDGVPMLAEHPPKDSS